VAVPILNSSARCLWVKLCRSFINVIKSWSSVETNVVFCEGTRGQNLKAQSNTLVNVAVSGKPVWCESYDSFLLQKLVRDQRPILHCIRFHRKELPIQFCQFTLVAAAVVADC